MNPMQAPNVGPGGADFGNRKCGYIAFFNGKQHELYADSLWAAKQAAIAHFKPSRKREHLVSVVLAEKDGQPVVHTPDF